MGHSSLPGLEEKEEIEGDKRWDASACVFFPCVGTLSIPHLIVREKF